MHEEQWMSKWMYQEGKEELSYRLFSTIQNYTSAATCTQIMVPAVTWSQFGCLRPTTEIFQLPSLVCLSPCCTGSLDSTSCFLLALGLLLALSHLALFNLFQKKQHTKAYFQKRISWCAYMAFLYRNRLVPSWKRAPFWNLLQFSQSGNCRRF